MRMTCRPLVSSGTLLRPLGYEGQAAKREKKARRMGPEFDTNALQGVSCA